MYEMLTGLVRSPLQPASVYDCVRPYSFVLLSLLQPPFYSQNLNIMYQQILNATLTFPSDVTLSAEAKSLLEGVRPRHRISTVTWFSLRLTRLFLFTHTDSCSPATQRSGWVRRTRWRRTSGGTPSSSTSTGISCTGRRSRRPSSPRSTPCWTSPGSTPSSRRRTYGSHTAHDTTRHTLELTTRHPTHTGDRFRG